MRLPGYENNLPNCDRCGHFLNPKTKGTSSFFVPDSDVSYEENIFRCVKCTEKYGAAIGSQSVNLSVCQYIVR